MKIKILILIVLMASLVVAPPADPPTLEVHQFYGDVTWDAGANYQEVIAKVGSKEYKTPISATVCTTTCTGKYGYTEVLNVAGSGTVNFYLGDVKAGEAILKAFDTTKLDLDISTEPQETCEVVWDCTNWAACKSNKQARTCTRTDSCGNVTAQKPAEEKSCVSLVTKQEDPPKTGTTTPKTTTSTPKTTPKTTTPKTTAPKTTPTTQPVGQPEPEESNLIWWILGGLLLIGAIVALILVLKKKPAQPQFPQ